jgi:hypothetical protein
MKREKKRQDARLTILAPDAPRPGAKAPSAQSGVKCFSLLSLATRVIFFKQPY